MSSSCVSVGLSPLVQEKLFLLSRIHLALMPEPSGQADNFFFKDDTDEWMGRPLRLQ